VQSEPDPNRPEYNQQSSVSWISQLSMENLRPTFGASHGGGLPLELGAIGRRSPCAITALSASQNKPCGCSATPLQARCLMMFRSFAASTKPFYCLQAKIHLRPRWVERISFQAERKDVMVRFTHTGLSSTESILGMAAAASVLFVISRSVDV